MLPQIAKGAFIVGYVVTKLSITYDGLTNTPRKRELPQGIIVLDNWWGILTVDSLIPPPNIRK